MVVLVTYNQQTIYFAFMNTECCSFDLEHAAQFTSVGKITDIIFIDLYTVYLVEPCKIEVV